MSYDSTVQHDLSTYCHCTDCRRAHAAPVYQVVYVKNNDEKGAFKITKGKELITDFRKEGAAVVRAFCKTCGTRLYSNHDEWGMGMYPGLLDQPLPENMKPTLHYCIKETIMGKIDDGLAKLNPEDMQ